MQMVSCAKATQADPAARPRLTFYLAIDDEAETEPEDLYFEEDRPDPGKDG